MMLNLQSLKSAIVNVINASMFLDSRTGIITEDYGNATLKLEEHIKTLYEVTNTLDDLKVFETPISCLDQLNPEYNKPVVTFKGNKSWTIEEDIVSIDLVIQYAKKYINEIAFVDLETLTFNFTAPESHSTNIILKGLGIIGTCNFTLKEHFLTRN